MIPPMPWSRAPFLSARRRIWPVAKRAYLPQGLRPWQPELGKAELGKRGGGWHIVGRSIPPEVPLALANANSDAP